MEDTKLTKNFNLVEFHCKDGTKVPAKLMCNIINLADQLQIIRDEVGSGISIISAYRTKEWNAHVEGKVKSQHLVGKAADLVSKTLTPKELAAIILKLIKAKKITQGGVGIYPSFVHYDIRGTEARW